MLHAEQAVAFVRHFFRICGAPGEAPHLAPLLAADVVWREAVTSTRGADEVTALLTRHGLLVPVGNWTALPAGDRAWLVDGELERPAGAKSASERLPASFLCREESDSFRLVHAHLSGTNGPSGPTDTDRTTRANTAHRLLHIITDNIPGGVHCCLNDDALTISYVNDGFLELVGYTREELATRFHNSLVELIYEPDRRRFLESIRGQLAAGHTAEEEYRIPDSRGRLKWVLGKGRLLTEHGQDMLYCVLLDTTELKNAQTTLRRTEDRYRSALQATNLYVFESELPDDTFRLLSAARQRLFRVPPTRYSEAMKEATALCHPEDLDSFLRVFGLPNLLDAAARGEEKLSLEFRLRDLTNHFVWYSLSLVLMADESGLRRVIGCLNDIDERKRRESRMLESAQTDGLTGLYNKTCTEDMIRRFLEEHPVEQHAFLLVDIDNFKAVNDNLGHLFGDAVLADISARLKNLFRASDILGRIGGDEFVVFLKNVGDGYALTGKVDELCDAFRRSYAAGPQDYAISCSVGVALAPRDGIRYTELYRKADDALYMAKSGGKNRYCVYDAEQAAQPHTPPLRNTVTEIADTSGRAANFQENLLNYVFSVLYEAQDIDTVVNLILGMIGDHYGVSRAYVFENSPDDLYCSNTYEWCAKDIEAQKERLQNLAYADLGDVFDRYSAEGVFYCRDIDALEGHGRELVQSQGIRAMLHVAIFDERRPKGFVGFDECRGLRLWTQDEIDTLSLLAKIVGIFVLKRNISTRLVDAYHDIRAILDSMAAWTYVIDQSTYELLYLNEATRQFVPGARIGEKCHQAFFGGRRTPCEHCPMRAMLERGELRTTLEVENPSLGVWTEATASRIPWSGGNHAVLMCCTDITRYRLAECQPTG